MIDVKAYAADPALAQEKKLPGKGDLCVVVGAGRSGIAASKLIAALGARARLLEADSNRADAVRAELEPLGVEVIGGAHGPAQFEGAAFVVPSPGMPLGRLKEVMGTAAQDAEILAETELAWRCLDGEPVIAVTGTSGKTTTVSLTAAMLREDGREVFLGGNIGTPLSEYILAGKRADAIVLEVSSFQLQACSTLHPVASAIINITPNHLDYHADMAEYIDAKFRLLACQGPEDTVLLDPPLLEEAARHDVRAHIVPLAPCGRFTEMKLIGRHNESNAEAAWQLVSVLGCSLDAARRAVASFEPLPHRLERVLEKDGILYVNDSKCTTISSMETALAAFDRPVLLLCGGRYKGGDPASLLPLMEGRVRAVAGFGESEEIFAPAWKGKVDVSWFPAMRPAMEYLRSIARPGDVVLLSPGTSSFDLYKGMAFRGAEFKALARELA